MTEEKTYTQNEVDDIIIEERFVTYRVMLSANIPLRNQPAQCREAREKVAALVANSSAIPDDEKEKFRMFLIMSDNLVPFQDIPTENIEVYNKVIKTILAPRK